MKTEDLLKRLVKDKDVLFAGTAEQCERAADELFALAKAKGLSPGRSGCRLQLFEARKNGDSAAVATINFAPVPRERKPKLFRFSPGEFPVVVVHEQSVVLGDE